MTINPLSSIVQEGSFLSEELPAAQHIFMTFDFEFNGGNIRLDPTKFIIITSIDTPILGIIPYSTTNHIPLQIIFHYKSYSTTNHIPLQIKFQDLSLIK